MVDYLPQNFKLVTCCAILSTHANQNQLTFAGLAEEIDCRGVKACMVCETPAANMNSSLSSELVLPRAFGKNEFKLS